MRVLLIKHATMERTEHQRSRVLLQQHAAAWRAWAAKPKAQWCPLAPLWPFTTSWS